jgi:hypothetical protein
MSMRVHVFQQSSMKGKGTLGFVQDATACLPLGTQPDRIMVVIEPDVTTVEELVVEQQSMWSQEDHPAKTSPWLDAVQAWMEAGADCSGTNAVSLI